MWPFLFKEMAYPTIIGRLLLTDDEADDVDGVGEDELFEDESGVGAGGDGEELGDGAVDIIHIQKQLYLVRREKRRTFGREKEREREREGFEINLRDMSGITVCGETWFIYTTLNSPTHQTRVAFFICF